MSNGPEKHSVHFEVPTEQLPELVMVLGDYVMTRGINLEIRPIEPETDKTETLPDDWSPVTWSEPEEGEPQAIITCKHLVEFASKTYGSGGRGRIFYNMLRLHEKEKNDSTYAPYFYEDELIEGIYAEKLPEMMRLKPKVSPYYQLKLSSFQIIHDYIALLEKAGIIKTDTPQK